MSRTLMRGALGAAALSLLALVPAFAARPPADPAEELVYVGVQGSDPGQGVVAARLDVETGRLTPLGVAIELQRPTWLAVHPTRPVIYAVGELGNDGKSQGKVHTLRADLRTGALTLAGTVPSGGGGPTHLAFDARASVALVANYGTGQVAALPVLADDTLGAPVSVQANEGSGPSPRQKGPHAHGVTLAPGGRFALVADLGADRVFVHPYDRATHRLSAATSASVAFPPGSGPRHLAFRPDGKFVFVLAELTPEIRVYRWNGRRGRLDLTQTLAAGDPAKSPVGRGAEIVVSRDGRFAYASVRGEDVLVAYAIDRRTGRLSEIQRIAAGGKAPWSFAIDPAGRWLLVANQASDTVSVLARDVITGRLRATTETMTVNKPVSVVYLSAEPPRANH